MEILTKTNVVRFIEISISLGLKPHTLRKDDRDVLMFTRIIQKYWLKILHTFLGKKMLNLDMEKKQLKERHSSHSIHQTIMFCALFLKIESLIFLLYVMFSLLISWSNWS